MIAHIRQPNRRESATPLIRARQMVAETLLPDEPAPRRRPPLRKVLIFAGLVLLALAAAVAYYSFR
jgi:hypothetical protein